MEDTKVFLNYVDQNEDFSSSVIFRKSSWLKIDINLVHNICNKRCDWAGIRIGSTDIVLNSIMNDFTAKE